jgi:hypothetical protein
MLACMTPRRVASRSFAGLVAAMAGLYLAAAPATAQQGDGETAVPVELELVLAVDGSWSVDQAEFILQMQGIAAAFRDSRVISAIQGAEGGIAVSLVVWSSAGRQEQVVPFVHVEDQLSALAFATRVAQVGRGERGQTAIADALLYCAALLEANGFAGDRRTIDISGDGINNQGRDLQPVRNDLNRRDITVNGLPILNDLPLLDRYYEDKVIVGDAAFIVAAEDYETFASAMLRKLLREILGDRIVLNFEATMPDSGTPEREPPSRM